MKKLKLRDVAMAEAETWRNLLPPEPWAADVTAQPGYFANWVQTRLQAGHRNARCLVVDARKAHQAFRPVPVVGVAERIALRALTDWVLDGVELSQRTHDDYRRFVAGPLRQAFRGSGLKRLSDATVEYVVQADISAFYQFVDHGVLLAELENRTGKVDESRMLVELLGEIQGATYGLPQLLDPSDKLAEVYMQVLERDVVRRVGHVWRFNDDFRLAVNGYGNAQQALEDLAAAARPLGLVLNDQKSSIVKFASYFWRHSVGDAEDPDMEVNPEEIEIWDEGYPDLGGAALIDSAEATLSRLDEGSDAPLDLLEANSDDVRSLRWAFNALAREASPSGLPYAARVFEFVPQLTPRVCDYLVAANEAGHSTEQVWLATAARDSEFNAWQRAWLTYTARACGFLSGEALAWLQERYRVAIPGLLHAELSLALAMAGKVSFSDLDMALRTEPEALAPWYAIAMNHVEATDDQRSAVRASSRLYELLVRTSAAVAGDAASGQVVGQGRAGGGPTAGGTTAAETTGRSPAGPAS